MTAMASPILGVSIVYSTVCSGADQRTHQNSASLAFVRGIHRGPVNSPHKGPAARKMLPFDDVIMTFNPIQVTAKHLQIKILIESTHARSMDLSFIEEVNPILAKPPWNSLEFQWRFIKAKVDLFNKKSHWGAECSIVIAQIKCRRLYNNTKCMCVKFDTRELYLWQWSWTRYSHVFIICGWLLCKFLMIYLHRIILSAIPVRYKCTILEHVIKPHINNWCDY